MARERAFTQPRSPEVAALKQQAQANIDGLERRVKALEAKVVILERLADYVRDDLYVYLASLAAAVPFAGPPEPPDR